MSYYFFFSYSRNDHGNRLSQFYHDLVREISVQSGISKEMTGFRDRENIHLATVWPKEIEKNLKTARCFIYLHSPSYYKSTWCAKEWQAFKMRQHDKRDDSTNLFMFPIVWIPCHNVPDCVKLIQLDENFDHMYLQEGLREIIRQKKKQIYDGVLKKIAVRIVRSVEQQNLPEINNLPLLKDIYNPFLHSKSIDQECEAKGPSYASFIYIAANKSEIQKVKTNSEAYGNEGGWDWKPYFPKVDKEIAFIAQSVSSDVKIRCEHVSSDVNPLSFVENACKYGKIVILIIDPWSLQLQDYANKAGDYDAHEYLNCAVMVSFNSNDLEALRSKESLKNLIQCVFIHKSAIMNPETFKPNISTYDEMRIVLSETLQKIQSKLIHASKIKKHISGSGFKMKPLL